MIKSIFADDTAKVLLVLVCEFAICWKHLQNNVIYKIDMGNMSVFYLLFIKLCVIIYLLCGVTLRSVPLIFYKKVML